MAAHPPTVSIVVPVHNAEAYIRETIAAVRAQTYTDWELLLIDDASTDESAARIGAEIAADIPGGGAGEGPRIRFLGFAAEERAVYASGRDGAGGRGAAATRNSGIDEVRGRYIAFLDADDVWYPEKLERQVAYMRESGAAFSFTSYVFGDEAARPTKHIVHAPGRLDLAHALTRIVIFTSTVMLDREQLPEELVRMPQIESEDTACWWRILQSGVDAHGIDEVLTVYRRPARSLSSNKGRAVRRIWRLYREIAGVSVPRALACLVGWGVRAVLRRVL